MLPLNRVPGVPPRAVERLAEFGIDTAERLQRNLRRDDTRRELEQIVGAGQLAVTLAAVQRALGVSSEPEPEPEPEPVRTSPRPASDDWGNRGRARQEADEAPQRQREAAIGRPTAAPTSRPPPAQRPPAVGMQDSMSKLDALREQLTTLSRSRWRTYVERAQERLIPTDARFEQSSYNPYQGDYVVLDGVDQTKQGADYDGRERVILHPDRRYGYWVIECDADLNTIVRTAREVQSEFGFPRDALWDVVGTFRKVSWCSGTLDFTKEDLPFIGLQGIFIHDQFAVFLHPQKGPVVPGLQAARAEASEIRGSVELSDDADPPALLEMLVRSLALNDFALFGKLWTSNVGERDLRYHFNQFDKAYAASEGNIAFERYDANQNPDNYPECGQVKIFVRRQNTDGSVVTKPLTFIQQSGAWKIYSGAI